MLKLENEKEKKEKVLIEKNSILYCFISNFYFINDNFVSEEVLTNLGYKS